MSEAKVAGLPDSPLWRHGPLLLAGLGGVIGGVLILVGGVWGALAIVSCLVTASVVWFGVSKPGVLLMFFVVISSTAGALRSAGSFEIGGVEVSISGLTTGAVLLGTGLTLLGNLRAVRREWLKSLLPFWILSVLAIVRSFSSPSVIEGLRDATLITTPFVLGLLTRLAAERDAGFSKKIMQVVLLSSLLGAVAILGGLATDLVEFTEIGMEGIPGRSMSLYLLVVLGLSLACWRQGDTRATRTKGFRATLVILGIIVATLSRMATVIALAVQLPLGLVRIDRKRALRITVGLVLGVCLLTILMQWPAMRLRFLGNPDIPLYAISELRDSVPMTGRDKAWALVWANAVESPLLGHGTGTSRELVAATFSGIEHPHNEYLRVFHDMGLLGLIPFVWGWAARITRHWRRWKIGEESGHPARAIWHKAATLGALGVTLTFLTDNALLHVFVTGPLFIFFGLADASDSR